MIEIRNLILYSKDIKLIMSLNREISPFSPKQNKFIDSLFSGFLREVSLNTNCNDLLVMKC